MNTGLRAKTAAWLKANPQFQPSPYGFGWNCAPICDCCILGALGHALGVTQVARLGKVSIAGSDGKINEEVSRVLGLPHGLAVAITKDFDWMFEKGPLTWEAGLALLPE